MATGAATGGATTAVSGGDSVLGVEHSLSGRRWVDRGGDDRTALALSQTHHLPEVVGRVLAARGIGLDDAERFLDPRLRDLLPDPSHLKGMDVAAERLAAAVINGEHIALFGDYDVDGATSTSLLKRFLQAAGSDAVIYIPDRMAEGYGPNTPALQALKEKGASLVVTVDCGTAAFEPLQAAADAGLEVIVVDHHEAEAKLPPAVAVVNPNRLDEDSPHRHLAAVGVTFLLVVAVNRALRKAGWYDEGRSEPKVMDWLDLVALGTICDVVSLTGVNRALVAQGLKVMARRANIGLAALADAARLTEPPGTYHAGFVLGPRINAGGRVGEADLGARLLTTADPQEAATIAAHLEALNEERRAIEAAVLDEATNQVEAAGEAVGPLVLAAGEGWHPGVIGIVASRLKDRYNRPACVIAWDGMEGLGSGRSVPGVDLGAAVIAARQSGLLAKGGGHAMAAGFSLARDGLAAFQSFLAERLAGQGAGAGLVPDLKIDGALKLAGANGSLFAALARVAPFGVGNPEPRFVIPAARVAKADVVGADHVRVFLTDETGARLKGIAFRCLETDLGQALLRSNGAPLHIAGRLRQNQWQGRTSIELVIEDAAKVW